MTVENETIDGRCLVRIRGSLSIWEATATWSGLCPLLCAPGPLDIDLTAVEACDGAGIQILCQIHKVLAERPDKGRITGVSDGLREAMRLAGLDANCFPTARGEA
ncbi:MAG: STAS domain-containing protein [Desulfobacterales bacterium]|nr:STAS domain-containing protein [Desulfobacterales bacterium]